jgi:hypothetical protein
MRLTGKIIVVNPAEVLSERVPLQAEDTARVVRSVHDWDQ